MKSTYSHAFFVGQLNCSKIGNLDKNVWKLCPSTIADYKECCAIYHKCHVDAMIEFVGQTDQERPSDLQSVRHYVHSFFNEEQPKGAPVKMSYYCKDEKSHNLGDKLVVLDQYQVHLCAIHLFCFMFDIVLVAIEVDDSGSELNDLSLAHRWLMNWGYFYSGFTDPNLAQYFEPLKNFLPNGDLSQLIEGDNNFKVFQIVQPDSDETSVDDTLLYELGATSPIGSVNQNSYMSPAKEYFDSLMKENTVAAFKNWKGLALLDTFTILGNKNYESYPALNHYFPLIFMRCMFEKTFCHIRNRDYRSGQAVKSIVEDISVMERYYFYNNISFNFIPMLIYEKMSAGMGLSAEREELSIQVKEQQRQQSEWMDQQTNRLLGYVTIFTIISAAYDAYTLVNVSSGIEGECPRTALLFGIIATVLVIYMFARFLNIRFGKKVKKN